jgi:hypothetical protein
VSTFPVSDDMSDDDLRAGIVSASPLKVAEVPAAKAHADYSDAELDRIGSLADFANVQRDAAVEAASRAAEADAFAEARQAFSEGFDPEEVAEHLLDAAPGRLGDFIEQWAEEDPEGAFQWAREAQHRQLEAERFELLRQAAVEREQLQAQVDAARERQRQDALRWLTRNEESFEKVAPEAAEIVQQLDPGMLDAMGAHQALTLVANAAAEARRVAEDSAILNAMLPTGAQRAFREMNGIATSAFVDVDPRVDAVRPDLDPHVQQAQERQELNSFYEAFRPSELSRAHKEMRSAAEAARDDARRAAERMRFGR